MSLLAADIDVNVITLNATQIDALFATPQTLVAAPGAGVVLVPLGFATHLTRGTTVWTAVRNFQVQYEGDTTQLAQSFSHFWTSAGARDEYGVFGTVVTLLGANNFDPSNKALQLTFTVGDMDPGAADTVLKVHLMYARITGLY